MNDSSLPILKPKKGTKSASTTSASSPSKPSNNGTITPGSIKKEVNLLYPRIHSAEKEINTLKQQLPSNLNKVIIQLRTDIEKLGNLSNQNDEIENQNPEKTELQIKIDELESRLQRELDEEIQKSNKNMEKRIKDLTQPKPKNDENIHFDFNIEPSFDEKLDNLEEMFKTQQQKIQQRISNIEQTLARFDSPNQQKINEENKYIKQINDELDTNRRGIADIKSRLSKLRLQLDQQVARNESIPLDPSNPTSVTSSSSGAASQLLSLIDIPDLDKPIEELHNDIVLKQNEYSERVKGLKQRAQNCVTRIKNIDKAAVDIVTVTATLESRLTDVDKICKKLATAIKDLENSSASEENQKLIQELSTKVLDDHNKLKSEIENVRKKAIQYQQSLHSTTRDKEERNSTQEKEETKQTEKEETKQTEKEENKQAEKEENKQAEKEEVEKPKKKRIKKKAKPETESKPQ